MLSWITSNYWGANMIFVGSWNLLSMKKNGVNPVFQSFNHILDFLQICTNCWCTKIWEILIGKKVCWMGNFSKNIRHHHFCGCGSNTWNESIRKSRNILLVESAQEFVFCKFHTLKTCKVVGFDDLIQIWLLKQLIWIQHKFNAVAVPRNYAPNFFKIQIVWWYLME